jgi:hypothetical protein
VCVSIFKSGELGALSPASPKTPVPTINTSNAQTRLASIISALDSGRHCTAMVAPGSTQENTALSIVRVKRGYRRLPGLGVDPARPVGSEEEISIRSFRLR